VDANLTVPLKLYPEINSLVYPPNFWGPLFTEHFRKAITNFQICFVFALFIFISYLLSGLIFTLSWSGFYLSLLGFVTRWSESHVLLFLFVGVAIVFRVLSAIISRSLIRRPSAVI